MKLYIITMKIWSHIEFSKKLFNLEFPLVTCKITFASLRYLYSHKTQTSLWWCRLIWLSVTISSEKLTGHIDAFLSRSRFTFFKCFKKSFCTWKLQAHRVLSKYVSVQEITQKYALLYKIMCMRIPWPCHTLGMTCKIDL